MAKLDHSALAARKVGPAPKHTLLPSPVTSIQKLRILLADDSKQIRDALRREIEGSVTGPFVGRRTTGKPRSKELKRFVPIC